MCTTLHFNIANDDCKLQIVNDTFMYTKKMYTTRIERTEIDTTQNFA